MNLHDDYRLLAAPCEQRSIVKKSLTSPLKNRVWGSGDTPSGRLSKPSPQLLETASGCVTFTYKSASGRGEWLSRDPIAERGGINLYGYCANSPVIYRDPDGKALVGVAVGAGFGGFTGGMGAYLQGGSFADIVAATALGAGAGALVGLVDPSEGIGTIALIAGTSGGLGDLIGQSVANRNKKCPEINIGEVVGATIGSALSAVMGAQVTVMALELGASELLANFMGGLIGMAPGALGGPAGAGIGPTVTPGPNGPTFSAPLNQ